MLSLVAAVAPGLCLPKQMIESIHHSCYGRKILSNRDRPSEEEDGLRKGIGNWTEEERHLASQGRCRTYHLLPQK